MHAVIMLRKNKIKIYMSKIYDVVVCENEKCSTKGKGNNINTKFK